MFTNTDLFNKFFKFLRLEAIADLIGKFILSDYAAKGDNFFIVKQCILSYKVLRIKENSLFQNYFNNWL